MVLVEFPKIELAKLEPLPPALGFAKLGWFSRSKKFASNLKPIRSLILKFLLIPKSMFVNIGPGSAPRPRLESHHRPLLTAGFKQAVDCANLVLSKYTY